MCLCARVEDELSIKRKIRKAARANRLKNQERKKANALGTFESNLNHILKTLPLVQDEQSETRLPQQLQRCEQQLKKLHEWLYTAQLKRCAGYGREWLRQYLFDTTLSDLWYTPIAKAFMSQSRRKWTICMMCIFLSASMTAAKSDDLRAAGKRPATDSDSAAKRSRHDASADFDPTPAVDTEGVRVPDIISTLPLAKVAKLASIAEVVAPFDPAGAVVNNPHLLHKIMSMNVHGELPHAQARFTLRKDLLRHIGQPPHTNLQHLPEWEDRPQLSNMWRVFIEHSDVFPMRSTLLRLEGPYFVMSLISRSHVMADPVTYGCKAVVTYREDFTNDMEAEQLDGYPMILDAMYPVKPHSGPAKRWVKKSDPALAIVPYDPATAAQHADAQANSDSFRAGAADDMDVDTGGGVPANMYRLECAGTQNQYGQCWTNSLAHVLRAAGQHEERNVTGQDLRERLYRKCCEVYNQLNPDAVDTFFKTMSKAAVNDCIQSLIRKEGGNHRADVNRRLNHMNIAQYQLAIVQEYTEMMRETNTCWSELELQHLVQYNLISYDVRVHFDDREPRTYRLSNRGTNSRPKVYGTVDLWYGCAPESSCGHVMAVLPIVTNDDIYLAALSAVELPHGDMTHICGDMLAGTRSAEAASLSSRDDSSRPRSAAEEEIGIGARDLDGDLLNHAYTATAEPVSDADDTSEISPDAFVDEFFDSNGYAAAMGLSQQPDDDQEEVNVSAAAAADPGEEEEPLPHINLDGTHYEVLGVDPAASQDEIKAAYRAMALRYHPDKAGEEYKADFQRIQEAYEVLKNEDRRQAYDEHAQSSDSESNDEADEAGSESDSKPTPFQRAVKIIQQQTTSNGYAKEMLPKLKHQVPVRLVNSNFYEIMTQRVNDVDVPLTMNDLLNMLAREEPRLNALLNKHANLRKQVVSWMQDSDTEEFPMIHRSSCCLDFANGVLQWGPGEPGTMIISFWEHDDEIAPQLIARAHIEADFDMDWLRQDVETLLRDSPHFKAFIESKFSADEIYPFGFKTGRAGDTMNVSVRDAWLGFHGRLLIPLRLLDWWRCGNYDYGITGSGKTVVYELIESYHGAAYCMTLQDADHRDKFTINSRTAQLRMLTAQDFGKGEPVTAAQAQKMLSGEKTGTRDMQEVAGESQWKVPFWLIGNFAPPWADDSGALNNRLLLWYWEQQDGPADDSMLSKMLKEPRIPLILLQSYKHLHGHIKTTPSQQWSYGYFEKAREESAAHTVPFIEFLQCGTFTHNGATYTIAAEEGATTLKSRVEDVFKLYMESTQRSAQDIRVCDLKAYLAQASQAPVLRLVENKNRWKCLECEETVPEEGDESNCEPRCSNQCPPGVYKEDHPRRRYFYKPRDQARCKIWRTTQSLGDSKYIKNLRVTDDAASMYPTDEEGGAEDL